MSTCRGAMAANVFMRPSHRPTVRLGCRSLRSGTVDERVSPAPGGSMSERSGDIQRADLVRFCGEGRT